MEKVYLINWNCREMDKPGEHIIPAVATFATDFNEPNHVGQYLRANRIRLDIGGGKYDYIPQKCICGALVDLVMSVSTQT